MKNIVLCFDRTDDQPESREATNVGALLHLLDDSATQITWYHPGTATRRPSLRRRTAVYDEARAVVAEAYEFLAERWQPGDAIFLFGAGCGAYCARTLTRLIGTVGIPQGSPDGLLDYLLTTYALPRTARTAQDWRQVSRLVAELLDEREIAVPVSYLGLWDTVRAPGLAPLSTGEPLDNVIAGRHAIAIDGGPFGEPLASPAIEQVWFRGAHCDITGGPSACRPLADIALDWILDGAVAAGAAVCDGFGAAAPTPSELDALAGSARVFGLRRLPIDAAVHASVDVYLRAHPQYWRRLPARVVWADADWLDRSERLVHPATTPLARVENPRLTAVAS